MRRGSWWWTATLLGALGCAGSDQGAAQEQPPAQAPDKPKEQPVAAADKKKDKDEEKEEDGRRYDIEIKARGAEQTAFSLHEAALFVPEVSLFGGEGGSLTKLLRLRRNNALELVVPFRRIQKIQIGVEKEDRLDVKLFLLTEDGKVEEISGTIKAGLELRGTYEKTGLKGTAKLREVVELAFAPAK